MTVNTAKTSNVNIRKIAMTGVLAAIATVLMFLHFQLPFMPSFISLDFSELPALIAAFTLGPVSGVAVCFVKNLVLLSQTITAGVGIIQFRFKIYPFIKHFPAIEVKCLGAIDQRSSLRHISK